jgi:glycosyltransferase involved in cell wall biosynthesis
MVSGDAWAPSGARVTVVIPTYNRASWLRGAIESVLAQSHRDFALVVSDNASTDDTAAVVDSFDDPRLSYRRLADHVDLNEHFNRCVELAPSGYLFLLPDDDRMLPDLLATTVSVLDADPQIGLVHGAVRVVDEDGRTIADAHEMSGLGGSQTERGEEFIRRSIRDSYRVHASTALIRTEALEGLRLEPNDYPATDFGLWLRLALSWDVAFVDRTLAVYRIHSRTYTADGAVVTGGGYVQDAVMIAKLREVKLRLLASEGHRFPDARRLRRESRRATRRELVNLAGHKTLPQRRFGATLRTLAGYARLSPGIVMEAGAWKLLAGSILGPRVVGWIKRRRITQTAIAR